MRDPPFNGNFRTVSIVSMSFWRGRLRWIRESLVTNDHVRTIATEMDENPLESVAMDSGITSD